MSFFLDETILKSDVDAIDWQIIIKDTEATYCSTYAKLFFAEADKSKEAGDVKSQAVWILLGQVCALFLNADNIEEPLGIGLRFLDGRRTVSVDDFENQHLDLLSQILPEIDDALFKARVGDLLWLTKQEYQGAVHAIEGYLEAVEYVPDWSQLNLIQRSTQLANNLGKKNPLFKKVQDFLEARIDLSEAISTNKTYLIEFLLSMNAVDTNKYIPIVEKLAKEAESAGHWNFAHLKWILVSRLYRYAKDEESDRDARMKSAETLVSDAESDSANNRNMVAAAKIGDAIGIYRQIGGEKASLRVSELHKLLLTYESLSVTEMGWVNVPIDNEIQQLIHQVRIESRERVKGKSFLDALFELARITFPPTLEDVEKETKIRIKSKVISYIIRQNRVDEEGKVKAVQPGINPSEEIINKQLRPYALETANRHRETSVLCNIDPALEQIRLEHGFISRFQMYEILWDNPFVPFDRLEIYSRGLIAGFRGDYILALHLLLPQLENSLRRILKLYGAVPSGYSDERIQQDYTLGGLLRMPELVVLLGKDAVFDLQGLLAEPLGANLRNVALHGLMSESEFHQNQPVYLWWTVLWLCCYFKFQPPQDETDSMSQTEKRDN